MKFPNHHKEHQRTKECGKLLMKTFVSPSGERILYSCVTYCYRSIKESLKLLMARENFENDCEKWRSLVNINGIMSGVYHGRIRKSFAVNSKWFFEQPINYAIMLNVDWFQPQKHLANYSLGTIYLIIMKLLRSERFKRENVILVGIIPNMDKELPTNTFIQPMVDELLEVCNTGFKVYSKKI